MGTEICNLVLLGVRIEQVEFLKNHGFKDYDEFHGWEI